MQENAVVRSLIADFFGFARRRASTALALVVAGSALEGAGIVMLVPIVALILSSAGSGETLAMIAPALDWLGFETTAERSFFVLSIFLGLLAARFVVILLRDDLLMRLEEEFVANLRSRAYRRLARTPWAEVGGMRRGPVAHALTRDVDRVAGGVGSLIHGGVAMVMMAVQFALALALAPEVTLVAAALGLALFRSMRRLRERAGQMGRTLTAEDLALFESVDGFLRGLKPAKAHGLEDAYVTAFERSAARIAAANRAHGKDQVLARLIMQTAAGAIGVLSILMGVFFFGTAPANLIVTLIILARLSAPLQTVQQTIQGVRHAAAAYVTARRWAGGWADAVAAPAGPRADPLSAPPEIALVGVTYHGDDAAARPILDDLSARIPAGKVVALCGPSGAGKSTFCDIAVGLLRPDAGRVQVDGAPLGDAMTARLQASVAYVGQEPFLIEDKLRANLCWGCGPLSDDEIWAALEIVGADQLARGLQSGLDGSVRAEGMRFSGGERQRLRLARALLRRPGLMVLDEATNALDYAAESRVLRSVLEARGGATVILISHRRETVGFADHVLNLELGRLTSAGSGAPADGAFSRPGSRM